MSLKLNLENRVLGSLIGGAVGDALGAPCECLHYQRILKEYGDFQGFDDLIAVKAGWTPIGTVTDDTVLADLLIDAILENDGILDAHLFAKQWEAFEKPIDNPDGAPINRLNMVHWIERIPHMRNNLREINKRELGHGEANATNAVMYIAPVGLLCAGDPNKAALMAADVSSVNQHGAPRDVAAGYAAALAACFLQDSTVESIVETGITFTRDFKQVREMRAMLELAKKCETCDEFVRRYYTEILGPVLPFQDIEHLDKMHWKYKQELTCISWNSAEVLGPVLAMFQITRGQNAAAVMLGCAKLGRDADTISRCAGGIMGAWNGLDCIPKTWRDFVISKNRWLRIEEKGHALAALIQRRAESLSKQLSMIGSNK